MSFHYLIDQSNPTGSISKAKAQRKAMWTSFGFFLERATVFTLHYWPPDDHVVPILAIGFQPEPSEISPKARQLSGALTKKLRRILLGAGDGTVPWWRVDLSEGNDRVYFIDGREDTAGWNCSQDELAELCTAGVNMDLVIDMKERFRQWKAQEPAAHGLEFMAKAISRAIDSTATGYSVGRYGGHNPGERVLAQIDVGKEQNIWLDYELNAMAQLDGPESMQALIDGLSPPVQPGDCLRLDQAANQPRLTHASRLLGPRRRKVTHTLLRPGRAEWLAAIDLISSRADHFALCWRDELPAANGWRSDYGQERLAPFATQFGPIDFPPGARQMVGPLTAAAKAVICHESPHDLLDLEHHGPLVWSDSESPPSPWWYLLLLSGQDVLLESRGNGSQVSLSLLPQELAQLNLPQEQCMTTPNPTHLAMGERGTHEIGKLRSG